MASIPRRDREVAWFVWRGAALGLAASAAAQIGTAEELPWTVAAGGVVVWFAFGWKARQPFVVAVATAAAMIIAAVFGWKLRWSAAAFAPLWAVLFWAPYLALIAQPISRVSTSLIREADTWIGHLDSWLQEGATRFPSAGELVRIAVAAGAGLFAMTPFLHNGIMGGDDARWYTAVIADHLQQWRDGLGPVFVGQTRLAAIGTVMPLRVAPYLQHLTLALDFATGRHLTPYLLLNLALVLSAIGGGLSCYLCLRSLLPNRRTEACLLALLYLGCPAVIGMPYTSQLFMSAMTWPFLPLVFVGLVLIDQRDDFSGWAMTSAGCAACWLGHSPIGLWVTACAALGLALRWFSGIGSKLKELRRALAAAALFVALCGYVFVSLLVLDPAETAHISIRELLPLLHAIFPAVLLPVSPSATALSDVQLGWSLWAGFLAFGFLAWKYRVRIGRNLAIVGGLLVLLMLPVPLVTEWLWEAVPQAVLDVTNAVPTQRLYPILAACAVTLIAVGLNRNGQSRRRRGWVLVALLVGVTWSGLQLQRFRHRGAILASSAARSEEVLSPSNFAPARFSLGLLAEGNRFFSHGVMDYAMNQSVLGTNRRTYLVSNVAAVAPGFDHGPRGQTKARELKGILVGSSVPGDKRWVNLTPTLTLAPRQHYLLAFEFTNSTYNGVLQITGQGFYREYVLPMSGELFAFGIYKLNSKVLPLSNESDTPLNLTLTFVNLDPATDLAQYRTFARYELIPYRTADLPIRLRSLLPFVTDVRSPSAGWLETFRYFTPGWTATVNGTPRPVLRSWNGLVAVPILAGESEVRLVYRPPAILVASYWLGCASWAALALAAILLLCRGRRRPSGLPSD